MPITIVAITVALSTDYEVILISRIAEHYRRTCDNRAAVVSGIEHTGSVITSAAAIMVAVFAGFALADLLPVKQLGVGLGLAVFLDATVVRGVLVRAAMAVMGRGNWWWPGQRRALPQQGTALPQHGTALPQKTATTAPVGSLSARRPPARPRRSPVAVTITTSAPAGFTMLLTSSRPSSGGGTNPTPAGFTMPLTSPRPSSWSKSDRSRRTDLESERADRGQ